MTTFSLKRSIKTQTILSFVVLLGLLVFLLWYRIIFRSFPSLTQLTNIQDAIHSDVLLFLLLAGLLLFLGIFVLIFRFRRAWRYCVRFTPDYLETYDTEKFYKFVKIPYQDCIQIQRSLIRGNLDIVVKRRRLLFIPLSTLDCEPQEFITAFQSYVPAIKIQPALLQTLNRPTKAENLITGVGISVFIVAFLISLIQVGTFWLPAQIAWKDAGQNLGFPHRFMRQFAVQGSDTFYYLGEESFAANTFEFVYVKNGLQTSWQVPHEFRERTSLYTNLAVDENETPIIFNENRVIKWQGNSWQEYPYPLGTKRTLMGHDAFAVFGQRAWILLENEISDELEFYSVDLGNLSYQKNVLPGHLDNQELEYFYLQPIGSGAVLVSVRNKTEKIHLVYKENRWTGTRFLSLLSDGVYCWPVAGSEQLMYQLCNSNSEGNFAQRLSGNGEIEQTSLLIEDKNTDFYSMIVDPRGRLWLDSSDGIHVMEPAWGGSAKPIVFYSPKNSAIPSLGWSYQISDGRFWIGGSKGIVWMDTSQEKLPEPLPDWITRLFDYEIFAILVFVNPIIIWGYLLFLFYSLRRR